MTTFRAAIEKTITTREIVEIDAPTMTIAARRLEDYADHGQRRGITVVMPHDADRDQKTRIDVVKIEERA